MAITAGAVVLRQLQDGVVADWYVLYVVIRRIHLIVRAYVMIVVERAHADVF